MDLVRLPNESNHTKQKKLEIPRNGVGWFENELAPKKEQSLLSNETPGEDRPRIGSKAIKSKPKVKKDSDKKVSKILPNPPNDSHRNFKKDE